MFENYLSFNIKLLCIIIFITVISNQLASNVCRHFHDLFSPITLHTLKKNRRIVRLENRRAEQGLGSRSRSELFCRPLIVGSLQKTLFLAGTSRLINRYRMCLYFKYFCLQSFVFCLVYSMLYFILKY